MKNPLRVSIINWTGDRSNWGCQATGQGLLEDLREALGAEFELDLHLVPLAPSNRFDRLAARLFEGFVLRHLAGAGTGRFRSELFRLLTWLSYGSHLARLGASDVILFMAEGTLSGTSYVTGARLLMLPYFASTQLRRPVLSLNQTIRATNARLDESVVNTYRSFGLVAVREPASLAYVHERGLSNVVLIPDPAFRSRSSDRPLEELVDGAVRSELVCLTLAGAHRLDQASPLFRSGVQFAKDRGLQACGLFWAEEPKTELRRAHAEIGGLPLLFPAAGIDYRDVNTILSRSFCLAGGRYHSTIQAAVEGTPFVALPSGSHKTAGLLQLLEYPLPERSFDDADGIRADLERVYTERERLAAHLRERVRAVNELRSEGIAFLGRLIAGVQRGESVADLVEGAPGVLRRFPPESLHRARALTDRRGP